MKKIILLIGMPGAGKSSIGRIFEINGYTHISSSKLLTQSGYDIHSRNFSDEAVIELIKKVINEVNDNSSIILEGFPRNMIQLKLLEQEFEITKAVYLKIPKSIAVQRVIERIICPSCGEIHTTNKTPKNNEICNICGCLTIKREGDTKQIFKKRANYFAKNSYPIIRYFEINEKLIIVDATKTIDEIFTIIKSL